MKYIVTILDNITETSMPFNEFVVYRANHYQDEKHILLTFSKSKVLPNINIPNNLEIYCIGKDVFRLRQKIKEIKKKCYKNNNTFLIHMHQPKSAFFANFAMLFLGVNKKKLYTVHSTFTGYNLHNKLFTLINVLFAYQITCVSNTSYNKMPFIVKRIKKDRIKALQNGVDTERIEKVLGKSKKNKTDDVVNFVYVARIIPIKNHAFLLDVINEISTKKKINFLFIGSTENADNILEKCKEDKLDKIVNFTGLIPRNEVFDKIYNSDVYITSSTLEGMPVSVLEAMYCKLPVILSDIPQHRELANGEEYIPVIPFKIEKWKNEILKYTNMTNEERKKIGLKCQKYVKDNFSLEAMHKKYTKVYDNLLQR